MKLLLLLLLVSCAAPMEELIEKAKECVTNTHSISVQGIVSDPTDEQTKACWADVNKLAEAQEKREEKRKQSVSCPMGEVRTCRVYSRNDKICGCVRRSEVRDVLGI